MRRRGTLSALAIGVAMLDVTTWAHHSISGIYDDKQRVTIQGVVTQFHFLNPHPFLVLEVRDEKGNPQRWTAEMDNRYELAELGFETGTVKPGDHVIVLGFPARRHPHSLYVRRIDRPSDGFSYQHHP
jgi:hypothetical protein